MSGLTDTTQLSSLTLDRPGNSFVTFTFGSDPARPGITEVTIPEGSKWTPGPHWHETYVEIFQVKRGRAIVKLNGQTKLVTSEDGPQVVDKFVIHEFMRADRESEEKDEGDVIVEEWTDPADGMKHVFFRNIFSTLKDSDRYWRSWTFLQALLVCAKFDNYMVLVPGKLAYPAVHCLFVAVRAVSSVLGLRSWYPEYTPEHLRAGAAKVSGG